MDSTTSRNYKGKASSPRNQSADIPDAENCALWLTGLPAGTTATALLGSLRNVGRVWAAVVSPAVGGVHGTAAAKLVFFDREGVDRLLRQAGRGAFAVGGVRPKIQYNRVRVAAAAAAAAAALPALPPSAGAEAGAEAGASRVVLVGGPPAIVNAAFLGGLFRRYFTYDVDRVEDFFDSPCFRIQIWHFASYRAQAENAMRCLLLEKKRRCLAGCGGAEERALWREVAPSWGIDPCDVTGEEDSREYVKATL